MKHIISVLVGVSFVAVFSSQGSTQELDLSSRTSRKGLTAELSLGGVPIQRCRFSLHLSSKRSELSALTDQTLLIGTEGTEQVTLPLNSLPNLKRRGKRTRQVLFARGTATCGIETTTSSVKRVKLRTARRGLRKRAWLRRVKEQVLQSELTLTRVFSSLSLTNPLFLTHPGDGTDRIFILEQGGQILVFPRENPAAVTTFLDVSDRISTGGERGLLGLAFSPTYSSDGFFFINYTDTNGNTVISRFSVSNLNPSVAEPGSEQIVLTFTQPFNNHNGGCLNFGPDGYLYISSGDGGSGGDPQGNAQRLSNLLGKILRINVSSLPYTIPSDNPFASSSAPEIYAYGLRNPWRFSFDFERGRLFAADVGQNQREEVNLILPGGNYGWNVREGDICFPSTVSSCQNEGLLGPIAVYDREVGQSITGGYVYRGNDIPSLRGVYLYGDYASGRVFGLTTETRTDVFELLDMGAGLSSFGIDQQGEVYLLSYFDGRVLKLQKSLE